MSAAEIDVYLQALDEPKRGTLTWLLVESAKVTRHTTSAWIPSRRQEVSVRRLPGQVPRIGA